MKIFRKAVSLISAAVMLSSVGMTVSADEASDMIPKDEIIDYIWSDLYDWDGGDDGTQYAEGSFKYHLITSWVEDYYGKDVYFVSKYYDKDTELDVNYYEWSDLDTISDNYSKYLSTVWEHYDDHDDDNGNYYLSEADSSEMLYRFEFVDGMWNQIDMNGNTVDTFPPFSTIEDESSSSASEEDSENDSVAGETGEGNGGTSGRVTGGKTAKPSESGTGTSAGGSTNNTNKTVNASENAAESLTEGTSSSSSTIYIIVAVLIVGVGIVAVVIYKKKK